MRCVHSRSPRALQALAAAFAAFVTCLAVAPAAAVLAPGGGVLLPSDPPEPALCFGPGTPLEEVADAERERMARAARRAREEAEAAAAAGLATAQYRVESTWSWTASQPNGRGLGDPVTLTWSIVPDGTPMASGNGEPAAPSDLREFLTATYGSESFWMPALASVFARWGELTGVTYVYAHVDDGAAFPSSPGLLGVRGDVRLAGHRINGTGGVIGYNWYPNVGDMVLDTDDANFAWGAALLKNVVAHEHGHGLGLGHVCPRDQTKLMEPTATTAFDGPQHDDIRAGNRAYGDDFEANDAPAVATALGEIGDTPLVVDGASVHEAADRDVYRVSVGAERTLSAALSPVGRVYLEGPQLDTGACSAGTSLDSGAASDLALEVLAADGTTVLGSASGAPAGAVEEIAALVLPGAGTYFVRVSAAAHSAVQLYDLTLWTAPRAVPPEPIFADDFESGDLEAWDAARRLHEEAIVPQAAMGGTDLGLRIAVGDPAWLTDRSPRRERRYRARFWLDVSGYEPRSARDRLTVLQIESTRPSAQVIATLQVRRRDGGHQMRARARRDDGTFAETRFVGLPDAPVVVEVEWQRASAPGAADGALRLWIDADVETPPARRLVGLDNDELAADTVRFGAVEVPPGGAGAILLDRFESRRSTFIGP